MSVLPSHTGRGLGRSVSAALTLRALAGRSGVSTLGVYVSNASAVAIHRRLGDSVAHLCLRTCESVSLPAGGVSQP